MEYLFYLGAFFVFFGMVAAKDFRLALELFAGLLPAYVVRFPLGPLPSTALEGMVIILLALWGWQKGRNKQAWVNTLAAVRKTIFFWPGIALVLASLTACFVSDDLRGALGIWRAYFLQPFLIYLIAIDQLREGESWRRVFVALGCSAIALTFFAVYQFATGEYLPTWEWTEAATRRATGVYTSPNSLALFVVPIGLWFLAQLFSSGKFVVKRFDAAVVAATVITLAVSQSKGGMTAFTIGALFVLWQQWSKKHAAMLAAALLVITMLIPATRNMLSAYIRFENPSGQSRLALYTGSLQLLKQSPVFGTGLAGFGSAYERVRPEGYTEKLIYPHNIVLNFWLETGLLGLLAILWIMITVIRKYPALDAGVTAALLAMVIHGLVDVPYFKNDLAMLTWIILAAAAWHIKETHSKEALAA